MSLIAQVYADLIKKDLKTIDDVPTELKEEVQKILSDEAEE